ncbi:MAG: inositol monophosphatase [Gemmatimonadetes bacterium]|nr:inositol monophosphatase [Gemmatimonadota bacterium]MBI2614906.1 inositol monophosphatase [Gemmatimonadota bacterium]
MRDYRQLADLARSAAEQAAAYIRSAKRPPAGPEWSAKGLLDYVTEVDRASEQLIAEALTRAVPGSEVLGEELSPQRAQRAQSPTLPSQLLWVVDPLDGTTNYLHGYPQYAVSIAALVDGQLVAGVVLDVERNLVYHATAGGGAWCDGERLAVSGVTEPSLSLIGTGFPFRSPHLLPRYLRHFTAISAATAGIRRAGSAALDLVDVARGRFEGFWELDLAAWDVAAGTLIVREAGGIVTDLAGSPDVVCQGSKVAGNPAIHAWLLELLATC